MDRKPSTSPRGRRPATAALSAGALLVLALAVPGRAQEEPWQMVFESVTEVNVVNVEVVVTDAKGRPVTGLTAADFELLEDGEPVAISNFYAVENGVTVELAEPEAEEAPEAAPAAERRPHHVILYFDNANIGPANRGKALARVREFLLDHWREGMRVMVATNDGPAATWAAAVRLGFTDVPHDVFVALDQLAGESTVGPRFDIDRRNIMRGIEQVNVEEASDLFHTKGTGDTSADALVSEAIVSEARSFLPQIQGYAEQYRQHVLATLTVLDGFVETAAGLPGRKSILYVSDGLPLQPGYEIFEAYTRRFEMVPGVTTNVDPLLEANRFDTTKQFEAIVAKANASRVTFYSLDVAPPAAASRGSAADRASSGGNFASWRDGYDSNLERNRQQSLVLMASGTGGRFGLGLSATEATLDGILQDMDNHYSLGYVADRREADRGREIEVRVKNREGGPRKDLKIRHRSSLRDKSTAERAAEGARALLLVDDPARVALDENPLGVALETREQVRQEDGNVVVPLLVKVPLGKLVLLPGETEHVGRVSMYVAVRDEKGRTSQVNHHLCPIRIPNADVLTALGQSAACGVRLLMRAGRQRVAVAVLDETAALYSTVSLDLDVGAAKAGAEQTTLR